MILASVSVGNKKSDPLEDVRSEIPDRITRGIPREIKISSK